MNNTHEVISAFLDDETFDAAQLADALSEPSGRAVLIDAIALRHIMQPSHDLADGRRRRRPPVLSLLAAAAVVIAIGGAFWLGEQRGRLAQSNAPAATRVIETGEWQPLP